MTKYLDQSGLSYYHKKIKGYVDNKVNKLDLSLYKYVSALPTDINDIESNKIYLVNAPVGSQGQQNVYIEYIYTGETKKPATYDATKWERLGECNTPYLTKTDFEAQKGAANGVAKLDSNGKVVDSQLWNATDEKHGLMSATDKAFIDSLPEDLGTDLTENGKYENVVQFDSVYTAALAPTIQQSSVAANYKVVFVTNTKTFAALANDKLYSNWPDGSSFGAGKSNGRAPEKKKLYVCMNDGLPYYTPDGSTLQPCVGTITNGEIDSMLAASI